MGKLRFGVEILDHDFESPEVLETVEKNIPVYGIEEILFWGANNILNEAVPVPGFDKCPAPKREAEANRYRNWLKRYDEQGVLLVADGREPSVPENFFECYPEARRVSNGVLWNYLSNRTRAIFSFAPELDRIESFLWETWLLNGDSFFDGMHWSEGNRGWIGEWYYEPVDWLVEMITAFCRGAEAAGKEYSQKGFSTRPWQERLLVEAICKVPRDVPLRCSTQMQIGDFNPFMAPPALVPANQTRPMTMYFDCFGEYLGRSQIPYCFPERIQHRLRWALEKSAALDAVRGRVNFADRWNVAKTKHLFGTPNEINLVALCRLAEDPGCCMSDVWKEWAQERYGKNAAEAVIRALRRSVPIVRNGFFFHGMTLPVHSQIPTIPQMELRARHLGQDVAGWCPDRVEENALLTELAHDPSDYVLQEMLTAQRQAQRLCQDSLQDIESARPDLSTERFEELSSQFQFTSEVLSIYELLVEVFVRVRMKRHSPDGNGDAVAKALSGLEGWAKHADSRYGADCIVQGQDIRAFIQSATERKD